MPRLLIITAPLAGRTFDETIECGVEILRSNGVRVDAAAQILNRAGLIRPTILLRNAADKLRAVDVLAGEGIKTAVGSSGRVGIRQISLAKESWRIIGEYFDNCNCTLVCPCPSSRFTAMPTEGHCEVVLAIHINRGNYGVVDLSGLNAVQALSIPGPMVKGNGVMAVYVDDCGSAEQRDALEKIFTGAVGGPPSLLRQLAAEVLPTKAVPIEFTIDGNERRLSMPEIANIAIDGVIGASQQVVWLEKVFHPFSSRLAVAQAKESHYQDDRFLFRNSGRNGHFSAISWSIDQ